MSKSILSAGIFGSEPGQRLLTICDILTRRAFHGLYAKCNNNINGTYYQTGLKRVHVWSDDIVNEDIEFVKQTCPDIDETYETCFVNYVDERFRGSHRPVVKCPVLVKFVRRFLESIALHEHMQTAEFFTSRDVAQRRIACIDGCRQAFYSMVNVDSVRIEMESVVSRNVTETRPSTEVSVTPPSVPHVLLESEEPEILPSDSVSQIDVPRSVVSHAREVKNDEYQPPTTYDDEYVPNSPEKRNASMDTESPASPPVVSHRHTDGRKTEYTSPTSREERRPAPPAPPSSYVSSASYTPRRPTDDRNVQKRRVDDNPASRESREVRRPVDPPAPPSSYISTASSTSRRRADDHRVQIPKAADTEHETKSDVSRHDFEMVDNGSVASLHTRSVVGSRDSSVSIGMKRIKSPHRNR